jgi:hypothetical protein
MSAPVAGKRISMIDARVASQLCGPVPWLASSIFQLCRDYVEP